MSNQDYHLVRVADAAKAAAAALQHQGDCVEDTREMLSMQPEHVDLERLIVLDAVNHGQTAEAFLKLSEAIASAEISGVDPATLMEIVKIHMAGVRFAPVSVRAAGVDHEAKMKALFEESVADVKQQSQQVVDEARRIADEHNDIPDA